MVIVINLMVIIIKFKDVNIVVTILTILTILKIIQISSLYMLEHWKHNCNFTIIIFYLTKTFILVW
jgi:hypothetical protein